MKTKTAVLWQSPGKWQVEEVDLAEPGPGDVLIQIHAAGLCHSDDHFATGDSPAGYYPWAGGHEGAGIVTAIGSEVRNISVGDHVVTSFIPSCGQCRWCSSGMGNLCDEGARIMALGTGEDDEFKMRLSSNGTGVGQTALLGTWSEWTVAPQESVVPISKDVPLTAACLLSCAVPTGWGTAQNGGQVQPGDVVIVVGTGGIGMNAVQASRHLGASHILAVDPAPFKCMKALEFGATEAFSDLDTATDRARQLTNGQGADVTMVCVGVNTSDIAGKAYDSLRKAGTVVFTGLGAMGSAGIPINLFELPLYQKRVQGALFGAWAPRYAIPRLVELYQAGNLMLEELVTRTYALDEINDAAADLHDGSIVRGVIQMEH